MDDTTASAMAEPADGELAAIAAELTAAVLTAAPGGGAWAYPPLAGGAADQADPLGNPYWRIIRNLPTEVEDEGGRTVPTATWWFADASIRDRVREAGLHRALLSRRYSWSIPSPGDIAWITATVGARGVVELGAGSGYWAALMRAAGIDTLAYDPFPAAGDNTYATRAYTRVESGDESLAAEHSERALFLCWPNNNDPWAARALTAYRGDLLIYAGQEAGGATADDRFFELLGSGWEQVDASADHVTYRGVSCRLSAWRR
jgi:hypothetical protein